jgi:hypothetical protein
MSHTIRMSTLRTSTLRFLGITYNVSQENKCYYKDTYIPLVVDRLSDGTIDGATAYFNTLRDNVEPDLYEELGFAEKEICPRHGKISSCWQLNKLAIE